MSEQSESCVSDVTAALGRSLFRCTRAAITGAGVVENLFL